MAENDTDDFFDEANKKGAPSAELKKVGDFVQGEILAKDKVDKTEFGTNKVEFEDDGVTPKKQLRIILQTESRNWAKVAKVPTNKDGSPKDPSEDDGKRAIYIPKFGNLFYAYNDGLVAAGVKAIEIGGWCGVKIIELEDTGKGNPLKKHAVKYRPPVQKAEEDPFAEFDSGEAKTESKVQDTPAADTKVQDAAPADEAKTDTPVEEPPF
jgi:hypothetical protein